MKIITLSKSEAAIFQPDVPWACISISTFAGNWPKLKEEKLVGLLQLCFADVSTFNFKEGIEEGYTPFKEEHAKEILKFVDSLKDSVAKILVISCELGVSRSPAIAAALDGEEPIPSANKLVYETMIKVMGDYVDKQLIRKGSTMTTITLTLTDEEIKLLRNSTSDLGEKDKPCVSLNLKIANAILDARILADEQKRESMEGHK